MIKLMGSGYVDTVSPTGSSRSWKSTEMEIQSLLEKLLDVNDSMSRCAASAAPTTSVTQKLARHRDILHEFTQVIVYDLCIYLRKYVLVLISLFSKSFIFFVGYANAKNCMQVMQFSTLKMMYFVNF